MPNSFKLIICLLHPFSLSRSATNITLNWQHQQLNWKSKCADDERQQLLPYQVMAFLDYILKKILAISELLYRWQIPQQSTANIFYGKSLLIEFKKKKTKLFLFYFKLIYIFFILHRLTAIIYIDHCFCLHKLIGNSHDNALCTLRDWHFIHT